MLSPKVVTVTPRVSCGTAVSACVAVLQPAIRAASEIAYQILEGQTYVQNRFGSCANDGYRRAAQLRQIRGNVHGCGRSEVFRLLFGEKWIIWHELS